MAFYLLEGPTGRRAARPDLEPIAVGGRLAVLYSPNDLVGAFARDSLGTWELEVVPGGEGQPEKAIRLGVNLALYALCPDYKEDQVPIPFIMKRRRIWEGDGRDLLQRLAAHRPLHLARAGAGARLRGP